VQVILALEAAGEIRLKSLGRKYVVYREIRPILFSSPGSERGKMELFEL